MDDATTQTADPDSPPGPYAEPVEGAPPRNLQEQAYQAALKTLDYRDLEGRPIIAQVPDEHRPSWALGVQAGIEALTRLVPPEDPAAFAMGQLWLHQRAIAEQINVLTNGLAEVLSLVRKYRDALPDPDSLIGRMGRWRGSRRGGADQQPQIGPTGG